MKWKKEDVCWVNDRGPTPISRCPFRSLCFSFSLWVISYFYAHGTIDDAIYCKVHPVQCWECSESQEFSWAREVVVQGRSTALPSLTVLIAGLHTEDSALWTQWLTPTSGERNHSWHCRSSGILHFTPFRWSFHRLWVVWICISDQFLADQVYALSLSLSLLQLVHHSFQVGGYIWSLIFIPSWQEAEVRPIIFNSFWSA